LSQGGRGPQPGRKNPWATAADLPAEVSRVITLPGVYAPQSDSLLLAEALRREGVTSDMDVLDLCAGSGALGLYAARLGARVTAVDVGKRAVLTARLNAFLARQPITVHRGDLVAPLPDQSFDVVISNPPYVPAPATRPPRRGAARAWDAGQDGRALLDRICDSVPDVLRPHGVLLIVHSGLSLPEATLRRLTLAGMNAAIVDRVHVPFGPVVRRRMPWLRHCGLVRPQDDREELVIIRAEKM
jgi:release factor glutamine methyltransferase